MNNIIIKNNLHNIINNVILLYAFSIPLFKNFNKIIAITLLILWILNGNLKNKSLIAYKNKTILLFFIFIIYSYTSIFWSDNIKDSIHYVSQYLYYFSIIIIFTSIKKEYIPKAITAFLFGMLISEFINYGIYFDLWTTSYNAYAGHAFPTAFMGHTAYSVFIVFTMFLILNKLLHQKQVTVYMKIFYLLLFFMTFITLMISGGRTGILILLAIIIIIPIIKYRKNISKALIGISIILIFLFLGYKNINIFQYRVDAALSNIDKIINKNDFSTPFGTRVGFIHLGLEIFKDNPILGVGIKDNIQQRLEYALKDENEAMKHFTVWATDTHFHNEYIEILTSLGLLGLFIFSLFLYSISRIKIKNIEFNNIKYIFIIMLLFSIATSAFFHHKQPISFLALFIGLLLAYSKYEQINLGKKE